MTKIHDSINQNLLDIKAVESAILAETQSINSLDKRGMTPLHLLLVKVFFHTGEKKIQASATINVLINHGADVNAKCEALGYKGKTALHMAVDANCLELVKCLIANKANINATDEYNDTALLLALQGTSHVGNARMESVNIVRFLVAQGADSSIKCLLTGVSAKYYAENFAWGAVKNAFFSSDNGDFPNVTADDNQSEEFITPKVALMQLQKLFSMAKNPNPSLTENEENYQNSQVNKLL